jgi:hypothetical protein
VGQAWLKVMGRVERTVELVFSRSASCSDSRMSWWIDAKPCLEHSVPPSDSSSLTMTLERKASVQHT